VEKMKKCYAPPTLVEYGRMEELTRGPYGGTWDSIIGLAVPGVGDAGGWGPIESWRRSR
jgi:hypothetical protein